ncbi:MAG: FG-GAP repeat protein [Phycisphaerales bacterium JB065]
MRTHTMFAALAMTLVAGGTVSAQTINEDTLYLANDGGAGDQLGYSVGATQGIAIVGAVLDDDNGSNAGAAYLFDVITGQQTFKLLADDGSALDQFGWSVGISGDIAIVGARFEDANGNDSGAAYLFDATTGQQLFKLTASDAAAGDQFGYAVAIFGDIAIVGAPLNDDNGANSGSAYLFDVTTGQQITKLLPADGAAADQFGTSVGISETRAIVGAYTDDDNGANSGSAYLFDLATSTQTSKLKPSDGAAGDQFGFSVGIADGVAIVGALLNDDNGANSGSAYLFDADSGSEIAKLTANDAAAGDQFGYSVAIGGGIASVGARFDDAVGVDSGSAYFFNPEDGTQINKIVATDAGAGDQFGYSVAAGVGAAIFGAPFHDDNGANAGAAYFIELEIPEPKEPCLGDADGSGAIDLADLNLVLANFGNECENPPVVEEGNKITATDASAFSSFGYAMSASSGRLLVGARGESENGANAGAAYLIDTATDAQIKILPNDGEVSDRFGNAVAIEGDFAVVGAEGDDTAENGDTSGSAYVFDAATGDQITKLIADDGEAGDQLGFAVDISTDRAIVSAPSSSVNGPFSGSAYIFNVITGEQGAKLVPDDGTDEDRFGYSVALSGNTALVGALFDDDHGENSGSAYVFDATTGAQLFKLTASDAQAGDLFGSAVLISGNTAIIGAIGQNEATGAVYLFDLTTGDEIGKLTADDGAVGDSFGLGLAISGSRLVVTAPGAKPSGSDSGAAYLFDLESMQQIASFFASDGAEEDLFGYAAAIDGDLIAIGARLDDDAGTDSGSAYYFNILPGEPCPGDTNADGATDLADLNAVLAAFGQVCPK